MQRQSLGSPSSKLHSHGVGVAKEDTLIADEPPKTHRLSSPPPLPPHKFIHFIPVLILLCFFILYLSSHPPSPSDLDQFSGFKRLHKHQDLDSASEIKDIEQHYMDSKRSDVLAIRSLRNLQQIRLHRKLADF